MPKRASKPKTTSTAQQLVDAIANPTAKVDAPRLKIASGTLSVSNPKIRIQGLGLMPFPIRVGNLEQIEPFSRQAPYGKGTQTIVDTAVRNTREIAPESLTLSDSFQQSVKDALPDIAAKLGLPAEELDAELYKLLIYEKGGRFDWHRDAEKQRGMVGSLIVVLPCKFGGGVLSVRGQATFVQQDFSQARLEQAAQYVAFYADTEHSVSRVTSGVRVCLAYNLVLKQGKKKRKSMPSDADAAKIAVRSAVSEWMEKNPKDPMVVALEHQYTQAGLKPTLLKGVDREIADLLIDASQNLDCHLHIGMVSRHLCQFADDGHHNFGRYSRYRDYESGPVDYDSLSIGEVYDDDIVVDGWKNTAGANVAIGRLSCDESSLISLTPFDQWKPTQQDYEGYTGNAGNTLDRWYHKSAVVLWSAEHHFDLITRSGIAPAISHFLELREQLTWIDDEAQLEVACDNVIRFARAIINRWPRRFEKSVRDDGATENIQNSFAEELIAISDPDLIGEWLEAVAKRDWLFSLTKWIPKAIQTLGSEDIMPQLKKMLETLPPPDRYGGGISSGLPARDAAWILTLSEKANSLAVSSDAVDELLSIAAERFVSDMQGKDSGYRQVSAMTQATWLDLVKAALTQEYNTKAESSATSALFTLLATCEKRFDLRGFQAAKCVELLRWSEKKFGVAMKPAKDWHESVLNRLVSATQTKPQPPTNQVRPADMSCRCTICNDIATFLLNPNQATITIRERQSLRDHAEGVIRADNLDVSTATIRSGTPHGLVLAKNTGSYDRALKRYQEDLKRIADL
jgi:predicted 2-oxoglutarate/Fe(II)-dependent dioxygenase YbiX